jgi:hypothetical protein
VPIGAGSLRQCLQVYLHLDGPVIPARGTAMVIVAARITAVPVARRAQGPVRPEPQRLRRVRERVW